MINRRTFIHNTVVSGIGISLLENNSWLENYNPALPLEQMVTNEKYWKKIRSLFHVPDNFINLENGYFSPQPRTTLAFHQQKENYINTNTSWFMRKEQEQAIEGARSSLAAFLNCPIEELALTRNTTESMNIITSGLNWVKGDEVIIGNQDYGSVVSAFHQAAKRFGIIIRVAEIPLHPLNPEETVTAYTKLFSSRTRLVHLTHLINLTGQVVPVAVISALAHQAGIMVSVDAAHSIAQLKFTIPDLDADMVAASLHKWLCNPLGAGFLWMKKAYIKSIYPLHAEEEFAEDNIRKFEHQGTRPIQTLETIAESIKFHHAIGSELKEKRLRYLMRYWVLKVKDLPRVKINTPFEYDERCGAIANIGIHGFTPGQLADKLWNDYKIFTVAIDHPAVKGVRITPHIYNNIQELDKLVAALKIISG